MKICAACHEPVIDDGKTYFEVVSWVHGPKLDGPVLRERTGRMMHDACVKRLVDGQAIDQEELNFE